MSETMKEERQRVIEEVAGLPQESRIAYAMDRDADRLAAYERRTIKRDESVPNWATHWRRGNNRDCWWADHPNCPYHASRSAPDLRPDTEGPITLPIVDTD